MCVTMHLRTVARPYVLRLCVTVADLGSMPTQIKIQEVLARIRSGEDGHFSLTVVRSSGKRKGEWVTLHRCLYGAPVQKVSSSAPRAKTPVVERDHVDHGTLPITHQDGPVPRYKSPLISHIVGYNHYTVKH